MKFPHKKTAVIVCGPTASGKTAVAIQLALHFNTEIISADSRQCFRELNIGVARPTQQQLDTIPHHFIATHSVLDLVNAAVFETYALQKAGEIFKEKDVVVLAGGTGLYIKAFCEGLDDIPAVQEVTRNKIISGYHEKGIEWLKKEIQKKDPGYYTQGEMKNPQRMMRALEVMEETGSSILHFRKNKKVPRDFNILFIGIELPKAALHSNISTRVDAMVKHGLLEEVKTLLPLKHLNALQTVGYSELFEYLEGKTGFDKAVDDIKKNTRLYAKRQMTWFRKNKNIQWFSPLETDAMIAWIKAGIATEK